MIIDGNVLVKMGIKPFFPYALFSEYMLRGKYPCGARESDGGGNHTCVKPAWFISPNLSCTILYQSKL